MAVVVTLEPDDFIPRGVHEGYRQQLTELFCANSGVTRLEPDKMLRFMNLEVLWLNDNKISKLKGLEHNFRLKQLYLHNNRLATITNASCCLPKLHHLELLQLENNLLQDLKATLKVLQGLPFLTHLYLAGNPLANEHNYRASIIYALPQLELLDSSIVTTAEREAAVKLYEAKKIEKKMAFGSVVVPWDKPPVPPKGSRSACEQHLASHVAATHVRRRQEEREREAAALRAASRPRFEVHHCTPPTAGVLRQEHATPFQFIAKGRTPQLNVHASEFKLTPAALAAATHAAAGHPAAVHIALDAMRILERPKRTRAVRVDAARSLDGPLVADLRYRTDLLHGRYAQAYERILQLLATGPEGAMAMRLELIEEASGALLGSATLPLGDLLRDRTEKTYSLPAKITSPSGVHLADLAVDVRTNWNWTNAATDYLAHRNRDAEARADKRADALTQLRGGGGSLAPAQLADLARTVGSLATDADAEELVRVQPRARSAGGPDGVVASSRLPRALATFESKQYAAAMEALQAGDAAAAAQRAHAALRLNPTLVNPLPDPLGLGGGTTAPRKERVPKDSFSMRTYERPVPPIPDALDPVGDIVFDSAGYEKFLRHKALMSRAKLAKIGMAV